MQSFINNWRGYTETSDLQLLIEGRVDDVKRKYPELAKTLSPGAKLPILKGSIIDILVEKDPSGNQKYLMWAAKAVSLQIKANIERGLKPKALKADEPDEFSLAGVAQNLMAKIKEYHEMLSWVRDDDKRFRDITNVRDWPQLNSVVTGAINRKSANLAAKRQKERETAQAKSDSRVILDNEEFLLLRPESTEASCYYGKGTQWCISSTQSNNYFNEYTSEGKAFYFLFLAHLKNTNPNKKQALVINHGGGYPEFEEVFDAQDESGGSDVLVTSIIENILDEKNYPEAFNWFLFVENALPGAEPDEEIQAEMEKDYINAVKKLAPRGIKYNRQAWWESNDALKELAQDIADNIITEATTDTEENPPGPTEEEYNEKLAEYDLKVLDVDIHFPSETGASVPYWTARGVIDIGDIMQMGSQTNRLRWKLNQEQISEMGDEFKEIVDDSLNRVNIWPDDLSPDFNYGESLRFFFDLETESGSIGDFDTWLDNISWYDNKLADPDDFAAVVLENLMEAGYIGRSEKEEEYWPDEEEIQKQQELPLQELKALFAKYKKILK